MPRPRKQLISLSDTPYYHCVSRCVRRAYLCGEDKKANVSYEHRRQWVEDRLLFLSSVFAIDVCAFAVMSNHTHIVLHVNQVNALEWTAEEVVNRWQRLFKGTLLTQEFAQNPELADFPEAKRLTLEATISIYRQRLYDVSWFMRLLNEYIARQANREDQCTGRFWEGRFKSQALLDEAALAACMAYVDLNPIRAQIAKTPEKSEYTSIKLRISLAKRGLQPTKLYPFVGAPRAQSPDGLPFKLKDYLELVELTGRCVRHDKRGAIIAASPILERTGIDESIWNSMALEFEKIFKTSASSHLACNSLHQRSANSG